MTPHGVWLVARQEFRIRLRTGRWRWLLGAWVLVVGGVTMLLDLSLETGYGFGTDVRARGVPLFGFLMLFVLGAGAGRQPRPHLADGQRGPRAGHPGHAPGHPAAGRWRSPSASCWPAGVWAWWRSP